MKYLINARPEAYAILNEQYEDYNRLLDTTFKYHVKYWTHEGRREKLKRADKLSNKKPVPVPIDRMKSIVYENTNLSVHKWFDGFPRHSRAKIIYILERVLYRFIQNTIDALMNNARALDNNQYRRCTICIFMYWPRKFHRLFTFLDCTLIF